MVQRLSGFQRHWDRMLFLIYVNYLPFCVKDTSVALFAHDCKFL